MHPQFSTLPFLPHEDAESVWMRIQFECINFLPAATQAACLRDPRELAETLNVTTVRRLLRESNMTDPLEFWREMHASLLVQQLWTEMAKMLLAIPGSSAASERVFSSMGLSDRRARGMSDSIPLLTFVRCNVLDLGHTAEDQISVAMSLVDEFL
jgi:hypothetical protein